MAEAESTDNWFGSWLHAAKDKSSKVLEFVKKDLEEFGTVVKNEASSVVSSTGNVIERTLKLDSPDSTVNTMKRSFSSFIGQMNTVLNPSPDDSDTEAILIGEDSETIILTRLQRAIYDLQKNDDTFINDPDGTLEKKFQCWLEIIDDQLSDDRINKHLNSSVILRNQYGKFVPEIVPHNLFWKRYLFKKALLEDDIAHEEAMEKKEKKEKAVTEANLKWEHEDFAHYIELTEEEQVKLLEEYESEIKTKPVKGTQIEDANTEKLPQNVPKKSTPHKNESAISLDNASSNSSTDGDWEKISDIDKIQF